jgi:hypothetical protein
LSHNVFHVLVSTNHQISDKFLLAMFILDIPVEDGARGW